MRTSSSAAVPSRTRLREAVDRLAPRRHRRQRRARPAARRARCSRADEVGIGAVGVDDAPVAIGEEHPLAHRVDERSRRSSPGRAPAKRMRPIAPAKSVKTPTTARMPRRPRTNGSPLRLHQREGDRDADEPEGEDDQPADAADPLGTVDDRLGRNRTRTALTHRENPVVMLPVRRTAAQESSPAAQPEHAWERPGTQRRRRPERCASL